jgi:tetratricopeptide (TPR) repeat protein
MRMRDPQFQSRCLVYGGLALATLAVYLPALHHGFVEYDDQQYVTDNPRVQAGLSWTGLVWAFGFHAGNWHPLAWLSHMVDCQFYGASAGGHHLTSILLHVASTLLLFSVLNRMTNAMWRSAAVAALFAWHPLHVESVAWVAERKDVLCAFFWMLTLWLYVRHAAKPSIARYLSALGSFVLCLMAKPMGVTLPFVLLLLDYWPLKRVTAQEAPKAKLQAPEKLQTPSPQARGAQVLELGSWSFSGAWKLVLEALKCRRTSLLRLVVEKIPFLVLSAIACVLTLRAQELAIVSTAGLPVSQRVAHALAAYNHYLVAMFVPRHLAVYYPYQIHLPTLTITCAIIVLGLTTLLALNMRRRPWLMVGWLWYLGTLVPVIGLVQVGDQAWADRYTYLPLTGLFVAIVWFACEIIKSRLVLQCASVIVAVGLLAATSAQLGYWQNTRTLFEHADKVTPKNYMAITILGSLLAKEHKYDEAMAYYQTALRYSPTFPEAHFFLGNALDEQGRLDEAVAEYQKALWFRPTQEQTHIFMGIALAKQKKYDEAMAHYTAALKLNPDSAVAQNNLARLLHTQGKLDEAVEHYHAALEIDPKLALAHNNLGILLIQKGKLTEGAVQLREAMRLNPTNSETRLNLAFALNQQQQWPEAAELFSKIVRGDLPDPKAHYEFAMALAHLKRTREAMSQYASALLIQPDFPDALDGLAWILSTDANPDFRNGTEAVKMSERACELTGKNDPVKLKTLAAAYAETGRFEAAIKTLQTAKDLAAKANRQQLATDCSPMLEHFQRSEPWRGSP